MYPKCILKCILNKKSQTTILTLPLAIFTLNCIQNVSSNVSKMYPKRIQNLSEMYPKCQSYQCRWKEANKLRYWCKLLPFCLCAANTWWAKWRPNTWETIGSYNSYNTKWNALLRLTCQCWWPPSWRCLKCCKSRPRRCRNRTPFLACPTFPNWPKMKLLKFSKNV